ncbi:Protein-lysine N-methyltransferase efm4 [Psilocybe cubensis]|uniref:Protein-lysine N-methyltransferase efm4 n=2 Tax=Psilocybe cubensis TaxID=181762 RepID=A0ACB8H0F5_PSICU|nr:Protein-lysine N-methyltransferase efm4 [Psilocybe cubensis]KAH9481341.1 Protein-lysine N-methyltransferase efm4 [Psilocybe cubensis]
MTTYDALQPSKLGTKEHWDNVYQQELENFEEIGDEGEIWSAVMRSWFHFVPLLMGEVRFGEDSVEKMVDWVSEHVPPSNNASILEVGSGNGTLLFGLLEASYDPATLYGIDYSAGAVKLAAGIAESRGASRITFSECDFLNEDPILPKNVDSSAEGIQVWDLLLDKGTYDAIALGEKNEQGYSPAVKYPNRVSRLLKPGGFFLITSCNFTEEELKVNFSTEDTGLIYQYA